MQKYSTCRRVSWYCHSFCDKLLDAARALAASIMQIVIVAWSHTSEYKQHRKARSSIKFTRSGSSQRQCYIKRLLFKTIWLILFKQ